MIVDETPDFAYIWEARLDNSLPGISCWVLSSVWIEGGIERESHISYIWLDAGGLPFQKYVHLVCDSWMELR